MSRKLRDGEPVDVYLPDLHRLASLFGAMTDSCLSCAFVGGLPEVAHHLLRSGSRIGSMDMYQLLHRARAVLADDSFDFGTSTQLTCVSRHTYSGGFCVTECWWCALPVL